MNFSKDVVKENMVLFRELLTCDSNIYTWQYDPDGNLVSTNCSDTVIDTIFSTTGCKGYLLERTKVSPTPVILSAQLGLMWGAAFEKDEDEIKNIFVIGPVFNTEMSLAGIQQAVMEYNIPMNWRRSFQGLMQRVPVAATTVFFQDVLMLHYCVTGEKLSRGSIHFQSSGDDDKADFKPASDRHRTWLAEQALLNNVREGNLNFQAELDKAGFLSSGVRINARTPAMQGMISEAVFISLCARAAIEGGMSPDAAYTLGDSYIQNLMSCSNISEMRNIGHTMYEDYIRRVHILRTNKTLSTEIQACKDYIEMHPTDDLSLDHLAQKVGYSPYYLSRKFKKETDISIHDYIMQTRVEYAKGALSYSDESISDIAEELHFCSPSHFSENFRKQTGMLPQAYRIQTRKL